MKNIEVKILNPDAVKDAEKMMVAMARLTQRAEKISNMEDFERLINMPYKDSTVDRMAALPHPTIQKFGLINIAVVGASRRFLSQITRHQNEVKFMSGSLQYSDYSGAAQFCVPYEVTVADKEHPQWDLPDWHEQEYLKTCNNAFADYEAAVKYIGRDAAGYMMPQGLRNVLLISALPFEWKHIISQRVCNRNTLETQYVLLRCWEELYKLSTMFEDCGAACMQNHLTGMCPEGNMTCGQFPQYPTPTAFLDDKFKYLRSV